MRQGLTTNRLTVLERLAPGARIAIVRLRSLGDSVLTTPAVRLLKQARPDLKIAVVSDPRFIPVWEGNPDVDEVLPARIQGIRAFRPALCLNLHGGATSARLTLFSGAKFRAGFTHFRFPHVYNVRIPTAQEILGVDRKVHTAEHAASAIFFLGVPPAPVPRAQLFETGAEPSIVVPGPYAVIHAMASEPAKTWPAAFFISVAQYAKRELGLQPVFIAGPGEDVSHFQMWPVVAGASLDNVKALLARAALFIGNDSGPAHMAAAFGLPVVVIFGPSDPVVWAPWMTDSQVLVAEGPIANVTEKMVMRALDRLRVHA